jgi:hypothetical protein
LSIKAILFFGLAFVSSFFGSTVLLDLGLKAVFDVDLVKCLGDVVVVFFLAAGLI